MATRTRKTQDQSQDINALVAAAVAAALGNTTPEPEPEPEPVLTTEEMIAAAVAAALGNASKPESKPASKPEHTTNVETFETDSGKFTAFTLTHRKSGDPYKGTRVAVKCVTSPEGSVAQVNMTAGMVKFIRSAAFRDYCKSEGIAL